MSQNLYFKSLFTLVFVALCSISFGQKITTDASPLAIFTKKEKGIEIVQKDSLFSSLQNPIERFR